MGNNSGAKQKDFFDRHRTLCFSLGAILLLAAIMTMTNPDENKFKSTISRVATEVAGDIISGSTRSNVAGFGATLVASGLAEKLYDRFFIVHNYLFFSTCEYHFDDKRKTVGIGLFGQVFTMNSKQVEEWIKEETGSMSPLLGL